MDTKNIGQQTVRFAAPPSIAGYGNAVGKKEGQGPLASYFDYTGQDDSFFGKELGESGDRHAENGLKLCIGKGRPPAWAARLYLRRGLIESVHRHLLLSPGP